MGCCRVKGTLNGGVTLSTALCGSGCIGGRLSTQGRSLPPYSGSYEVTPGDSEQVLPTASRVVLSDIIIHPIPSNYGLITWNGSTLTVS